MSSPIDKLLVNLQAQRKQLEYEFKVELPRTIAVARAHGDLSENAEYHAAREKHAFVKAQLASLDAQIGRLRSIDLRQLPTDKAGLYSLVEVFDVDTSERHTYKLVTSEESDFEHGLISVSSPIGRALAGRKEGDEVRVQVPAGTRTLEIVSIKTVHDQADEEPVPDAPDVPDEDAASQ
jgi:transcription elongation factor GreA